MLINPKTSLLGLELGLEHFRTMFTCKSAVCVCHTPQHMRLGVSLSDAENIILFCWFASIFFWCRYYSLSFQSFALRHLVIAPVCDTKRLIERH